MSFVIRKAQPWYRVSEVAHIFGVHTNTVRNWCIEAKLPCERTIGNQRRFALDVLLEHGAILKK